MQKIVYGAVVAGLIACAQSTASAQPQQHRQIADIQEIHVLPQVAKERWVTAVSRELSNRLASMPASSVDNLPDDFIQIRFEVKDGKPVNVRTLRRTMSPWSNFAAETAVRRMRGIPDLPEGSEIRTVVANIILARSPYRASLARDRLMKHEAARLAAGGTPVLALNLTTAPAG